MVQIKVVYNTNFAVVILETQSEAKYQDGTWRSVEDSRI